MIAGGWREAHQVAHIAAAHAHRDLLAATDGYVDVFSAIRAAGVPLMLKPTERLFGVYLGPGEGGPGILVNSRLRAAELRHSAAHELGHHRFGHAAVVDESIEPLAEWGSGLWSRPEREAEAFAAWFLMPRSAVRKCLTVLGLGWPRQPEDVYRLALLLGVSYRGLARHLVHLRLAGINEARLWTRVPVKNLRHRLAGRGVIDELEDNRAAVHLLSPAMNGTVVYVSPGDLVVFKSCVPDGAGLVDHRDRPALVPLDRSNSVPRPESHRAAANTAYVVTAGLRSIVVTGSPTSPGDDNTSGPAEIAWHMRAHPFVGHEGIDPDSLYDAPAPVDLSVSVQREGARP